MKEKKNNVIPIVDPELEARKQFASHVQSIAFSLTLSRRMIDCLQAARDYGWPHYEPETAEKTAERRSFDKIVQNVHHRANGKEFVTHQFVMHFGSLKNRGLVYWNPTPFHDKKNGERVIILSRAGEMVCELLVECGLMAAKEEEKKQVNSKKGSGR